MTYYKEQKTSRMYVPFDVRYMMHGSYASDDGGDLFSQKAESIADRIRGLYDQVYQRKLVSKKLIEEVEQELLDTESKIYSYRYANFFDTKQKTSLEKRIDLLNKTRRSELVDYWRDLFNINIHIFEAQEEYNKIKNKRDLLQ